MIQLTVHVLSPTIELRGVAEVLASYISFYCKFNKIGTFFPFGFIKALLSETDPPTLLTTHTRRL